MFSTSWCTIRRVHTNGFILLLDIVVWRKNWNINDCLHSLSADCWRSLLDIRVDTTRRTVHTPMLFRIDHTQHGARGGVDFSPPPFQLHSNLAPHGHVIFIIAVVLYVPHFFHSFYCLEVQSGRSTGDRVRIKIWEEDGEQMGLREARSGKRTARAMAGITRRMQRREFRRRKFVIRRDFFSS